MVSDIILQKNELRKRHKNIRRSISLDDKKTFDLKIAEKATNLLYYKNSKLVLIYVSTNIEVGTQHIIEKALEDGKRVAVPKCIINTKTIDFYLIKSYDDLVCGHFGILEPDTQKCEKITNFSESVCFVPALSFDIDGYRLGYGGGYYDRFLENFSEPSIGLCYSKNISQKLPKEIYDQKVSFIVTEDKTYFI